MECIYLKIRNKIILDNFHEILDLVYNSLLNFLILLTLKVLIRNVTPSPKLR